MRSLLACRAAAIAAALALVSIGAPAMAAEPGRHAASCERAVVEAAQASGVPEAVLHAIALTETGRRLDGRLRPWPFAVNREGEGFWFTSRDEALAFARDSVAAGRHSFDLGCFQINYHWHGHAFASLDAMLDPATGAAYAARFLTELHRELGTWSAAAGAYHSRTPDFARRYRARFDVILAGLGGAPLALLAEGPGEDAAPRRSRTRLSSRPKIITIERAAPPAEAEIGSPSLILARGSRS